MGYAWGAALNLKRLRAQRSLISFIERRKMSYLGCGHRNMSKKEVIVCILGAGFRATSGPEDLLAAAEEEKEKTFSWALAEMTDRHNAMRDNGTTCTDALQKIHRQFDPDGSKAVERLLKSYKE